MFKSVENNLHRINSRILDTYNYLKKFDYDNNTIYTKPIDTFLKDKSGTCVDYVNYTYYKLKDLNPTCYYMYFKRKGWEVAHAFIVFPDNILVENAFKDIENIYTFNSLQELLHQMDDWWFESEGHTGVKLESIRTYIPFDKKLSYKGEVHKYIMYHSKKLTVQFISNNWKK
jgi:hypothetical protein